MRVWNFFLRDAATAANVFPPLSPPSRRRKSPAGDAEWAAGRFSAVSTTRGAWRSVGCGKPITMHAVGWHLVHAGENALRRTSPILLGAGLFAGLDRARAGRLLHDAGDAGLREITPPKRGGGSQDTERQDRNPRTTDC
jgi:hypothetical protein